MKPGIGIKPKRRTTLLKEIIHLREQFLHPTPTPPKLALNMALFMAPHGHPPYEPQFLKKVLKVSSREHSKTM